MDMIRGTKALKLHADPEAANEPNSEGETMGGATSEESESDNNMHDYRDY